MHFDNFVWLMPHIKLTKYSTNKKLISTHLEIQRVCQLCAEFCGVHFLQIFTALSELDDILDVIDKGRDVRRGIDVNCQVFFHGVVDETRNAFLGLCEVELRLFGEALRLQESVEHHLAG